MHIMGNMRFLAWKGMVIHRAGTPGTSSSWDHLALAGPRTGSNADSNSSFMTRKIGFTKLSKCIRGVSVNKHKAR